MRWKSVVFETQSTREETLLWRWHPQPRHHLCVCAMNIYAVPTVCQALYWVLGPRRTLSVWFAAVFSPRALDLWWKMRWIHFFQSSKNWLHRFLLNKQQVSETQVLEELATPSEDKPPSKCQRMWQGKPNVFNCRTLSAQGDHFHIRKRACQIW